MSTNYPTSLDTFTDPASSDTMDGNAGAKPAVDHRLQHANANDALAALESALGVTGAFNFVQTAGGTMSGAIAMGSNKITGLATATTSGDALNYGITAGGDLSGTLPSPTVAKVQGVSITSGQATILSQLTGATTTASSATATPGSQIVLTGTTASQTITLGASTSQVSSENVIMNNSTQVWSIAAGSGTTVNYNGTSGTFSLAPACSVRVVLIGTVWYVIDYNGLGQQAAYSSVTADYTYSLSSSSSGTWFASAGTPPSITLPNDGRTYRVVLSASSITSNQAQTTSVGIGTGTSNILKAITTGEGAVNQLGVPVVVDLQKVVSTGQVITVYGMYSTGSTAETLTVKAAAGNSTGLGPSELAAYRVG